MQSAHPPCWSVWSIRPIQRFPHSRRQAGAALRTDRWNCTDHAADVVSTLLENAPPPAQRRTSHQKKSQAVAWRSLHIVNQLGEIAFLNPPSEAVESIRGRGDVLSYVCIALA